MTPKVTYTLNAVTNTVVFNPDEYTLFTQEWERDEIEYKNPFTGDKTRKLRGYYYKAAITFEAVPYDLMDSYRDLFNANTTEIKFFPNSDAVECYEVDANENLSAEDASAALAYKNVEIVFRSKKRFDSALNYPSQYWGARKTIFSDSPTMETHRTQLNTADTNNLNNFNTAATNVQQHVESAAQLHITAHYTKAQVDALLVATPKKIAYGFAGSFAARTAAWLTNESGVGTVSTIARDGTITKIAFANSATYSVAAVNIPVTKGQLLKVQCYFLFLLGNWQTFVAVVLDGTAVHTYQLPNNFAVPFTGSVVLLQ